MYKKNIALAYAKCQCILIPFRLLLMIKLVFILSLSTLMQVSAASFAQKVTFSVKNAHLKDIFSLLKKQTGYDFLYNSAELNTSLRVSITANNEELRSVLDKCFINQPLIYTISKTTILIKKKPEPTVKAVQTINIKGKITDPQGEPLPGVNVKVKNTQKGTVSNEKGEYSIGVADENAVLVFSSLGFETLERKVLKNTVINVSLKEKKSELDAVVVTALNITREQRSLGYSAQLIDSTSLSVAPTDNWLNALEGKVAGLTLNSVGGMMGSSDIILRGDKSLQLGSSGALVVIDGVPIDNSINGTGASAYSSTNAVTDMGTAVGDVNPEDIASVTILKGPAATALYGARGANGAIVITTKSGGEQKGLGVTFNTNTSLQSVNRWPDYQYEYGAGATSSVTYYSYGASADGGGTSTNYAWGPKLNTGVKYFQYDPVTQTQGAERTDWIAYPNARKDFVRTGFSTNNSIAIDGGSPTTKARVSIGNTQSSYILENTGYQKTSVNFSLEQKINKAMSLSTKINYYNKTSDNLPGVGFGPRTAATFFAYLPPNLDSEWFRDYWTRDADGVPQVGIQQNRIFSALSNNPYFVLYENLNTMRRNGVFGNINFSYKISPFLTFQAKTAIDMYDDISSSRQPKSSSSYTNGMYREQNVIRYEQNSDFLLRYNRNLNRNFKLTASLGGNRMHAYFNRNRAYTNELLIPNVYSLTNGATRPILDAYKSEKAINSLYAFTNLSYKSYLYLELTARNDWSSVFALNNNSYFYPSANLSAIITDMFDIRSKSLNFLKARLSYAEVGNDTKPYRIEKYYDSSNFPYSLNNPADLPNIHLKPEQTKSYEAGLEGRFFKNRVGIDLTYYLADTYDQILRVPVDPSAGYYNYYMNAGTVRNNGWEMLLWGKVIDNSKFSWKTTFNGAINRGKILELSDEVEALGLYTMGSTGISLQGVKGGSIGDIYGMAFQRNPNGEIIFVEGIPQITTEIQKVGSAVPKFKGGIGQEFSYKGWKLNVLFDGEFGFKKYSYTNAIMIRQGKVKATLPGREEGGVLGKGVIDNGDGTWRPNDVVVSPYYFYNGHYAIENGEANLYDASFIKLRELRIEKALKTKMVAKLGLKRASIGLYGRNLLIWTKWPVFDPQNNTLNDDTIIQGIEVMQSPSTRTLGINLRLAL